MEKVDVPSMATRVGEELGVSDWFTIDQDLVDRFSDVAQDRAWIHNDPKRATEEGPFGYPVVQGLLTLSLLPYFVWQTLDFQDIDLNINYGLNRARFPSSVAVGSRLRARITLSDFSQIDDKTFRSSLGMTIEAEGAERPACVAELILQHILH